MQFNLNTGVVSSTSLSGSSTLVLVFDLDHQCRRRLVQGGDDRVGVRRPPPPTSPSGSTNSGSGSYAGDGTSGLYLYGAQLTQGVDVRPYAGTTSAALSPAIFNPPMALTPGGVEMWAAVARVQEPAGRDGGLRHRQQHVFDRDVVVLERFGLVLGGAHDPRQLRRKRYLGRVGTRAAQPRKLPNRLVDLARERLGIGTGLRDNIRGNAPLLLEQGRQHMFGRRLRVVFVQSARIGGVKRVAYALRHLLYIHVSIIRQGKVTQ